MDIPLLAPFLQVSTVNWKYRTVPMNNSCLGDNKLQFYISIINTIYHLNITFIHLYFSKVLLIIGVNFQEERLWEEVVY